MFLTGFVPIVLLSLNMSAQLHISLVMWKYNDLTSIPSLIIYVCPITLLVVKTAPAPAIERLITWTYLEST